MPVTQAQFTLTLGTAIRIVAPDTMSHEVTLHNMTKSSNEYIFVGNSEVGTANGIHIDPGGTLTLTLQPNDDLWAVSDPSGLEVGVVDIRKTR
jgi:hypothetical protein